MPENLVTLYNRFHPFQGRAPFGPFIFEYITVWVVYMFKILSRGLRKLLRD